MDKLLQAFQSSLPNKAKILFYYLYCKGPAVQISRVDLSKYLGCDDWQVEQVVQALKSAGFVEVEPGNRGNIYKVI